MILGPDGQPLPCEKLRPAIGFVPQMVKADESDVITGITPPAGISGDWYDRRNP